MALITYDQYKALTGVTDDTNQAIATSMIDVASAQIEQYCDRIFTAADYVEWIDGESCYFGNFSPRQYPINLIKLVGKEKTAIQLTSNAASQVYTIDISNNTLNITDESLVTETYDLTNASYDTLSELETAIESDFADIEVAVDTSVVQLSKLLKPSTYVLNLNETIDITGCERINAKVEVKYNLVYGMDSGLIVYNAGFTTIPIELQTVCANMVYDAVDVQTGTVNSNLKSESVTNYSYTIADNVDYNNIISGYISENASVLNYYKRISF